MEFGFLKEWFMWIFIGYTLIGGTKFKKIDFKDEN